MMLKMVEVGSAFGTRVHLALGLLLRQAAEHLDDVLFLLGVVGDRHNVLNSADVAGFVR